MNYLDEVKLAIYESGFDEDTVIELVDGLNMCYENGSAEEFVEYIDQLSDVFAIESTRDKALIGAGSAAYIGGRGAQVAGLGLGAAAIKKALDAKGLSKKIAALEEKRMNYKLAGNTKAAQLVDAEIRDIKKQHDAAVRVAKRRGIKAGVAAGVGTGARIAGKGMATMGIAGQAMDTFGNIIDNMDME